MATLPRCLALRLALVALAVLACACGGQGATASGATGQGPQPDTDVAGHAAPLLAAHDALRAYAEAVAAAPGDAATAAAWREANAAVDGALAAAAEQDRSGLGPAQRSALRGFEGGLRLARDAWADAHAAVRASDAAVRDRSVEVAAGRMRHLDSLRAGLE